MSPIDYSGTFDLYDIYSTYNRDIPFWTQVARNAGGEVLELMAGTGRISLPLLRDGVALTCLERDFGMLSVLSAKARVLGERPRLICGDVLAMPTYANFRLILLPFAGSSRSPSGPSAPP